MLQIGLLHRHWQLLTVFTIDVVAGLDREFSVRASRDELIERGILLPDVAVSSVRLPQLPQELQHRDQDDDDDGRINFFTPLIF